MSITDELREWAKMLIHWWYDPVKDEYTYTTGIMPPSIDAIRLDSNIIAIADRIDAEHERLMQEQPFTIDMVPMTDERMAEHGWIRLPKDADGEYIHVGDVLDGYGKTIEVVEMRHGRSGWVLISRDGNGYADTFAFTHHHAPTVEDVLREFADAWAEWKDGAAMMNPVETFAAKLRLAEGEDA